MENRTKTTENSLENGANNIKLCWKTGVLHHNFIRNWFYAIR